MEGHKKEGSEEWKRLRKERTKEGNEYRSGSNSEKDRGRKGLREGEGRGNV